MEDCKDCTTWEQGMYWNHFNTFYFTLVLPPNFHDNLVLPNKFAHHMKSQLPDKVSLKGPSGAVWEVQLFKTDEVLFVGSEWQDFVETHDLKENYRLFFKFKRNSIFEVFIFEQESPCEKESSYFVKKCMHLKSDNEDRRKRIKGNDIHEDEDNTNFVVTKKSRRDERVEDSGGETQTIRVPFSAPTRRGRPKKVRVPLKLPSEPGKDSLVNGTEEEPIQVVQGEVIAPKNGGNSHKNDHSRKLKTRSKTKLNGNGVAEEIISQVTRELLTSENGENPQPVNNSHQPKSQSENGNGTAKEQTKSLGRVVTTPDYRECSSEEDHSPESRGTRRMKKQKSSKSSKKLEFKSEKLPREYKSNRRPVSDKEKREAFQKATKRETQHSFTAILPPSSVYKRFYLSVPVKWFHDHLPNRTQEIVLRVGAQTWPTTLYYRNKQGAGFSTGWKRFALDNRLEESDVLVFSLSSSKGETPVLVDVEIFRVVPITAPLLNGTS